ncbi:hypothetical protein PAPHI01_0808 [Pancytospora philotis]|nr:hypothetical protein PAPHI01_0808 [Pancytospora philotis]
MFYAAEVLSLKNRTSLSMLYYLSTARRHRRVCRKTIAALDLDRLVDEIEHPSVPFSLRLYAYLLRGLVRAWLIKISLCEGAIKSRAAVPRKRKHRERTKTLLSPNLVLEEHFIAELDESTGLETVGEHYMELNDDVFVSFNNNFDSMLAEAGSMPIFGENSLASIEELRRGSSSLSTSSLPPNIGAPKTAKRTCMDKRCVLSAAELQIRPIKREGLNIPMMESCPALEAFLRHAAMLNKCTADRPDEPIECNDHGIWPDAAAPSIDELCQRSVDCVATEERETMAAWFYDLLLRASAGEIVPVQNYPYAEIIIK